MQCQVYYYYILQLTYLLEYHHYSKEQKKRTKKDKKEEKKKNHQDKSCYILIDIEMIHISITRKNKADFLFDENENQAKPPLQSSPPQEKKKKTEKYLPRKTSRLLYLFSSRPNRAGHFST